MKYFVLLTLLAFTTSLILGLWHDYFHVYMPKPDTLLRPRLEDPWHDPKHRRKMFFLNNRVRILGVAIAVTAVVFQILDIAAH